jgi:hypothetical protein
MDLEGPVAKERPAPESGKGPRPGGLEATRGSNPERGRSSARPGRAARAVPKSWVSTGTYWSSRL